MGRSLCFLVQTELISIICGIANSSSGHVEVFGHDNITDHRIARSHIGLLPQELTMDAFETVWNSVKFSRGLFGKAPSSAYIETLLKKIVAMGQEIFTDSHIIRWYEA